MMYTADQIANGLINYADNEIMGKLPTTGKWVMGTAIALASNKVNRIVETLQENPVVKMLGIVGEDGCIDVDALLVALRESADKYGNMTVDIPLIGKLTFSPTDVDNIKKYLV